MCAIQRNFNQQPDYGSKGYNQQGNTPPQQPPQQNRQQEHYRFRWPVYLGIPLVVLLFFWFVSGIEPAGTWEDFMDYIGIENQPRFTMLACLGLATVTVVAIVRVLQSGGKEGD